MNIRKLVVGVMGVGLLLVFFGQSVAHAQSCEISTTGAVCRREFFDERSFTVVENHLLWGEEEILAEGNRLCTDPVVNNTQLDIPQFSCVTESSVLYFGICDNGGQTRGSADDILELYLRGELIANNDIINIPNAPINIPDDFEQATVIGREFAPGETIDGISVKVIRDRRIQSAGFQMVVSDDPNFVARELSDFCSVEIEDIEIIMPEIEEPEPPPVEEPETELPDGTLLCEGRESINTAVGCVPIDSIVSFTSFFIRLGLGIGGGISFLMIVVAGYRVITSRGDPIKLQSARETLIAALSGLFLIILSAFALRLIGAQILGVL